MKKKANVLLDTALVMIVLVCLILGVLYLTPFNEELKKIVENDDNLDQEWKDQGLAQFNKYESKNDSWILIIFGFLWVVVIGSSFFLDANPVFFIISIVLLIGLLMGALYLGNAVEEIINDDHPELIPKYPNAYWIATHLLEILIATGMTISLVLFAKTRI
jgi:hypothetical protein